MGIYLFHLDFSPLGSTWTVPSRGGMGFHKRAAAGNDDFLVLGFLSEVEVSWWIHFGSNGMVGIYFPYGRLQ